MRRPPRARYDIITSAAAWSQIGTLDSAQFHDLQAELDRVAWGASHLRTTTGAAYRGEVRADGVLAEYELDHVAARMTVVAVRRLTPAELAHRADREAADRHRSERASNTNEEE